MDNSNWFQWLVIGLLLAASVAIVWRAIRPGARGACQCDACDAPRRSQCGATTPGPDAPEQPIRWHGKT